jgi:hypothetical protein
MKHFLSLAVFAAAELSAQTTHVAMDALMNIRYFPLQGGFMMAESVPVLFPSPGETKGRIVIKKAGGGVAVTKNVTVEPWPPLAAFGNLRPEGTASFGPIAAGDYVLSVEVGGKEISAYSFSVKSEKGTDPFDPKTELLRSGPWNKPVIILKCRLPDTGSNATVGLWMSSREIPGCRVGKPCPITIHVLRAGRQVGLVEGAVNEGDWRYQDYELMTGHGGGPVKWAGLLSQAGTYTLEYRGGGKLLRSYRFEIAGGKIARIPQNEISYAGADALPAQTRHGDTRYESYWLAPIQ